MSKRIRTESGR
jgi:hypothetical protein